MQKTFILKHPSGNFRTLCFTIHYDGHAKPELIKTGMEPTILIISVEFFWVTQ